MSTGPLQADNRTRELQTVSGRTADRPNGFNLPIQLLYVTFLPPANVVCEGYVFTPVCDSVNRGSGGGHAWLLWGACVVAPGGVHGCSGGVCMVALGGHVWGVYMGGMHGCSRGGMHGCSGGCMVALGGHVWLLWGACMVAPGGCVWDTTRYGDMVNERAVRILLECILVCFVLAHQDSFPCSWKFIFIQFVGNIFTLILCMKQIHKKTEGLTIFMFE